MVIFASEDVGNADPRALKLRSASMTPSISSACLKV